jgi:hypothetical protein
VVTLSGDAALSIELGSVWTDPGATAFDTRAGDLTGAIVITGAVNPNAVGSYTLIYAVSDGFNTATAQRIVTVIDTTAPTLGAVTATPSSIAVPNHKMVDVSLQYAVSDLSGAVVCSVTVTSNEPVNGVGDGNTTVDWQVLSPTHVRVRAERAGGRGGRVYTITVSCLDGSGNVATQIATVTVR